MTAPHESPGVDPDNVPETLCIGRFNLTFSGMWATLVFTHQRPKAGPLLDSNAYEQESVVRARIVTTTDNMVALRNLLNSLIMDESAGTAGGTTSSSKLN